MRAYNITLCIESDATKAQILRDFKNKLGEYHVGCHIGYILRVTVVAQGKKQKGV